MFIYLNNKTSSRSVLDWMFKIYEGVIPPLQLLCFIKLHKYIPKTDSSTEGKDGNYIQISDLLNGLWRKINAIIQSKIFFCL